ALSERHSDLANKVEAMCECLSHLTTPSPSVTQPSYPSRPSVKLDVPRFDGYDPLGWIFKISQFFEYQGTPKEERIMVASFYLDGPALSWFQWMFRNGFITSWPALLQAIEARFAPSFYDDPRGTLFKLVQRSSVQAFQPISLPQATSLARLQEDKINDRKKHYPRPSSSLPSPSFPHINSNPPPMPKPHFVQRTQEDMAYRREKGLCYNCDEQWSSSHRCRGRVLFLIADSEEPLPSEPPHNEQSHAITLEPQTASPVPEPTFDPTILQPHISLHAMAGVPATDTFYLYGTINKTRVTILIDSGSTHNFIQPRVAKFMNFDVEDTMPLRVMVGNGSVMECNKLCANTQLCIQGHMFTQPSALPPSRQHDHHINILPSANPVNVRPYRYPHFQKTEIERQVSTLLDSDLIRPSRSPFSSPILLVKKKDGTWRMCIDYRALNAITIRDRFPLPTIDELLDELGKASWFSKLDLWQGFHQILVVEEDIPKTSFRTH
ncbi:Transposon Ty3-G Gag-Pol polyprotein, partial [Glycine soja]